MVNEIRFTVTPSVFFSIKIPCVDLHEYHSLRSVPLLLEPVENGGDVVV